jgi:hypothetical protein
MTKTPILFLLNLPTTKFDWETWNCFSLANFIRGVCGLNPLPDFDFYYKEKYTESNCPPYLITELLDEHAHKENTLNNFYLVSMRFRKRDNLGTVYENAIIHIGSDRAMISSVSVIGKYITGIYSY